MNKEKFAVLFEKFVRWSFDKWKSEMKGDVVLTESDFKVHRSEMIDSRDDIEEFIEFLEVMEGFK
jgi:hypothetical protein